MFDVDRIRRLAATDDPFWRGAGWMLDQIIQPPETLGAYSCPDTDQEDPR